MGDFEKPQTHTGASHVFPLLLAGPYKVFSPPRLHSLLQQHSLLPFNLKYDTHMSDVCPGRPPQHVNTPQEILMCPRHLAVKMPSGKYYGKEMMHFLEVSKTWAVSTHVLDLLGEDIKRSLPRSLLYLCQTWTDQNQKDHLYVLMGVCWTFVEERQRHKRGL
jgi:hypothetical protein